MPQYLTLHLFEGDGEGGGRRKRGREMRRKGRRRGNRGGGEDEEGEERRKRDEEEEGEEGEESDCRVHSGPNHSLVATFSLPLLSPSFFFCLCPLTPYRRGHTCTFLSCYEVPFLLRVDLGSPCPTSNSHIEVLTPGPGNATYLELGL